MRRRETKEQEGDSKSETKVKHISKHWRDKQITIAIASSLAKNVGDSASTSRACSYKGNRENKYGCGKSTTIVDRICASMWHICHEYRS